MEGVAARSSSPDSPQRCVQFDLARTPLRELNQYLHGDLSGRGVGAPQGKEAAQGLCVEVLHPAGAHNLAVGLDADVKVHIRGHAGYYAAGMNKRAQVTVHGNAGRGLAENIMSGVVRVRGNASDCAAASGQGGLVIIEGDAASRCGISMKGCDIVVQGSVGHASAFMAQEGRLVVCGNAGAGLGDSLYEAVLYVAGTIHGLGADAREEPLTVDDRQQLVELLRRAGIAHDANQFKRVASARTLYHWNAAQTAHYG